MNYTEFWALPNNSDKWQFHCIVKKIQESFVYNKNPKARIIHHLMETDEQREFNSAHYERFGLNLDGTFEYGKYVIFVTKDEHNDIHCRTEEFRLKQREHMIALWQDEEYRKKWDAIRSSDSYKKKVSDSIKAKWCDEGYRSKVISSQKNLWTDERRLLFSNMKLGEKNPMYGKHLSEDTKQKIGDSERGELHWNYGKHWSSEVRNKMSISAKNRPKVTDETKEKIGATLKVVKEAYDIHKASGGTMSWNEFQRWFKCNRES